MYVFIETGASNKKCWPLQLWILPDVFLGNKIFLFICELKRLPNLRSLCNDFEQKKPFIMTIPRVVRLCGRLVCPHNVVRGMHCSYSGTLLTINANGPLIRLMSQCWKHVFRFILCKRTQSD
ncbi:hypothetical protein P879_05068 [Paragonimus westermani]|uniref:Uncharacterized protein n=1 Tax=Paragonimus westermani TaxID=34504 RepID=A0A8T0DVU3_9TREM|nr:hypothetical protein P879_05068 [Paragonimus westermani]